MPSEQCVRRYDAAHFGEHTTAQHLGLHGEAATLIVVQQHALRTELLSKDAILLTEIVDHLTDRVATWPPPPSPRAIAKE